MHTHEQRIAQVAGEMDALSLALPGIRVVALDLEYDEDVRGFVELGIAVLDHGKRYGRQIMVGDRPGGEYLHGNAERMSLESACEALMSEVDSADALAGHDLSGDRLRLRALGIVLPYVPVYDTARMPKKIFVPPFQPQLRAMLQIYGVPTDGLHVAGNDAWAVIDLLMEMGRQGPTPCAGPNRDYAHPRSRPDILRDRHTATGYEIEPGGERRSATP